jgi:hypothetical protein
MHPSSLSKLTIIKRPAGRGVRYDLKQNIVKISKLINIYCSSCISSYLEFLSKCSRIAVLVWRKIDATLTTTFPHDALSVP